jgi:hypothetical protein
MAKTQPFKDPLRQAGQSTYEELLDLIDEQVVVYVLVGIFLVAAVVLEWVRWLFHEPPHPGIATTIAVGYGVFAFVKVRRAWRKAKDLKLGMRGERMVGQELEKLRPIGYEVFHDVVTDTGNIDHVLIGPGGVFTVETKARSKANGAVVEYRGDEILVAGHKPDRDPLKQAKAQAAWVSALLEKGAGIKVRVKPVLLFPGWRIKVSSPSRDVWVDNERYFRTFIEGAYERMPDDEVRRAALALETYIRSRA